MADSRDHLHTTFLEQLIFALSIAARTLCALVAAYIFFGTVYLPAVCGVEAIAGGNTAYLVVGVATVVTAYFSIYGTNWTPNVDKYEWIDALFSIMLGIVVAFGVVKNWGSMSPLMNFTAWMFGTLIVLGIFFDWVGRKARHKMLSDAAASA